ncbi:macro domain-containing protein [Limnohabitans sp. DM1]|uniref:macro domain-containing protein n=1 Tax=Limnohabitans sp. DM1 TaxID=1597955 RepID=UPI000AAED545|nr:macro domain-containing protein [Limnohabitans sp. DM1]
MKIKVVVGNIVKQPDVEAVVNSANANLRLGSGVAGAIHTAAGPKLEVYCKPFAPLAYGAFLVTPGFNLPNLWVIHVHAASYTHHDDAPAILEQALQAAIQGAHQNDIRTLALPAIGTGVFAFPPELAAQIMAKVLSRAEDMAPHLQCLRLCVASDYLRDLYTGALEAAGLVMSQPASLGSSQSESEAV